MKHVLAFLLLGGSFVCGCDPDTTPVGGGNDSDAAAGSSGAGGAAAGAGGTAGAAGESTGGTGGEQPDAEADAADDAQGEAGAAGEGGATGYSHTIVIDGTNDFDPAKERFDSSSMTPDAYHAYITWDANYLYLGMDGKSIADHSPGDWVVVYLGGTPGTKTGLTYGAQTPGLPMDCKYHVRWKADGQYTDGQKWNGTAWVDANWIIPQASQGSYMELAISRLDFEFPGKVQLVVSMLRESAGYEWTWAGVPAAGLVDGNGASYLKYFEFDFNVAAAPNSYTPLP